MACTSPTGIWPSKLQICLYHRAPDLWEIPALIKSLHPGYRFYLGHHAAHHWSDLVLYAR